MNKFKLYFGYHVFFNWFFVFIVFFLQFEHFISPLIFQFLLIYIYIYIYIYMDTANCVVFLDDMAFN
ncbi:hypothetical protein MS2017_0831 [Bathymodiolus thermophilus thioautotrophic gill symbiont]|uniref:Uncharacterized protein n=1 Tax=Bathymodiolus thermophilus thioautotrophic gill symbiont TaxID=2360 RepID=A0A3G3IL44_9GAMM|nr:hypothetical protein MS2017_0831 [Bathymodiolus thermophilus thioautotrophic gill symbiont]